jgi:uncharacterized protein (TIGR02246 family)
MSPEAPVLGTLTRLADAWNTGDADAYGFEFTEDATYVVFNGELLRGRTAITDVHRFLFEGPLRGSRMVAPEEGATTLRFLRPDLAHLVTEGAVLPDGQADITADRRSIVSYVLVDQDGIWKIAAFQNTRAPQTGDPQRGVPSSGHSMS